MAQSYKSATQENEKVRTLAEKEPLQLHMFS